MEPEIAAQTTMQVNNIYALLAAIGMPLLTYWRTRIERSDTAKTRNATEDAMRAKIEELERQQRENAAVLKAVPLIEQKQQQFEKLQETMAKAIDKLTDLYSDIKADTSQIKGAMGTLVREKSMELG